MSSICEWFALCENTADGVVSHPVLGDVPTCQRCADRLGLDLRPNVHDSPWPNIERNVAVTPALARRFVPRNWCFAYNGHSIYALSGKYYAVTVKDGVSVITARTAGETGQDCQDLIALLSEWEAGPGPWLT